MFHVSPVNFLQLHHEFCRFEPIISSRRSLDKSASLVLFSFGHRIVGGMDVLLMQSDYGRTEESDRPSKLSNGDIAEKALTQSYLPLE